MNVIAAIVAAAAATVLTGLLFTDRREGARLGGVREEILAIALVNALFLVGMTELASAFFALTARVLSAAWVVGLAVQAPVWWAVLKRHWYPRALRLQASWVDLLLYAATTTILATTLVIALVSPPNNWDSMTYHMSRVAHWRQNHTVAFYATHIERQLYSGPFAEFVIAHLQIITGADRWANLVQWWAAVGSAIAASLLARQLGSGRRGQLVAVVFTLTLPMTVLQASSTQNDLVTSLWILCFLYFSVRCVGHPSWSLAAAAGGALGLALLTKSTALFWLAGLGATLVLGRRVQVSAGAVLKFGAACALGASLCVPHLLRNVSTFGHPLASAEDGMRASNPEPGIKTSVANFVRRLGSHLDVPPGRVRIAARVQELADRIDSAVGRFRPTETVRDPRPVTEWLVSDWRVALSHEDIAGGSVHLLLVVAVFAYCFWWSRHIGGIVDPRYLAGGIVLSLAGMSVLLKWSEFLARFDMTAFLLAAPLVGACSDRVRNRGVWIGLVLLVAAQCSYPLLWHTRRQVLGSTSVFRVSRARQYFAALPSDYRNGMSEAIEFLNGRSDSALGLLIGKDSYEYPLWMLVRGIRSGDTQVCHVAVHNESGALARGRACAPSAIYSDEANAHPVITIGDVTYARAWRHDRFGVYVPES